MKPKVLFVQARISQEGDAPYLIDYTGIMVKLTKYDYGVYIINFVVNLPEFKTNTLHIVDVPYDYQAIRYAITYFDNACKIHGLPEPKPEEE